MSNVQSSNSMWAGRAHQPPVADPPMNLQRLKRMLAADKPMKVQFEKMQSSKVWSAPLKLWKVVSVKTHFA